MCSWNIFIDCNFSFIMLKCSYFVKIFIDTCIRERFCIKIQHYSDTFLQLIPASKFVSSSIPSWQILTAHAQPFRGARDLAFCLKVPLDSLLVWASSEGSGETARMRRLTWTFAARICDKYQIRLMRFSWRFELNFVAPNLDIAWQYCKIEIWIFFFLLKVHIIKGAGPWENVSCHMRTTKAQISLHIRAVWSAPLLFAA